jgi:hypothetical protein
VTGMGGLPSNNVEDSEAEARALTVSLSPHKRLDLLSLVCVLAV